MSLLQTLTTVLLMQRHSLPLCCIPSLFHSSTVPKTFILSQPKYLPQHNKMTGGRRWIPLDQCIHHGLTSMNLTITSNGSPRLDQHLRYICNIWNDTDLANVVRLAWRCPKNVHDDVSKMTNKYCYEDWVVGREQKDHDGNTKKKKILIPCSKETPVVCHQDHDNTK